ncbi:MAG: PASTA domain-containing protein [Thermoanaerobaculaceae bacterium]|nr:PASTA domain-containing protein [Thermoanaerobaculaceae bacterium]
MRLGAHSVALGAIISCTAALANEVQFHICAAGQNLGAAYARTEYFNGEIGPDQSADVAANLANAAAHIAAAEAGVQQPFFSTPDRQRSIAELQGKLAAYARLAEGRSPAARMSMIQGFYTHYRNALSYSYATSRSDAFHWNPTCDSRMLDASWHLGLAGTYAAVRFDPGLIEEHQARSKQNGANGAAFQAIQAGLRLALDGTGPTPLEHCTFNTEQAWSIVPMLRFDEPHATYVELLPRVLEVCRSAGPHHPSGHLVTVPHLEGLLLSDAKRRLTEVGLTTQLAPGSPALVPSATGTVESQSVAAGTRVAAGTTVRLTVHSPFVLPPQQDVRIGTADDAQPTGRPDLRCPAEVPLSQQRDALPPGTRIPLLPALSGWSETNPDSPYQHFGCWYELGALRSKFLSVSFLTRGRGSPAGYCWPQDSTSLLGTRYIWSRRAAVSAQAFNGLHFDLAMRFAEELMRQVEPYAEPCPGRGTPDLPPTPAPVFQVPTPIPTATPPPAPPACPGPAVTVVFDLWNPPPYSGLGAIVCRDGAGGTWINVANNVYPVTAIQTGPQDPSSGCYTGTRVVTPVHAYEGTLCRK